MYSTLHSQCTCTICIYIYTVVTVVYIVSCTNTCTLYDTHFIIIVSSKKFFFSVINACNAALRSDKLYAMASRTRKQYLGDIVKEHASSVSLEQVGGGALGQFDNIVY